MKLLPVVFSAALAATCFSPSEAFGQTGHIGPSNSAIAGGMVAIGAGIGAIFVGVAVVHSHHVLSGCIVSGPNGTELKTADAKTWSLEGDSASVKPGDRVKVHGSRASHKKTASGAEVFTVDKIVKDYGSCEVAKADASPPAH